ncbi:hypothetical protein Tco_1133044 [Tanacetum coccineum]|uniref:Transposase (Putative), gypsy type n=1 Tax=Tanacetum coccineum TaxID=301880 RepID=A0ABQ5JGJ3_9ASTR
MKCGNNRARVEFRARVLVFESSSSLAVLGSTRLVYTPIPSIVHPELPDRNSRIRNSPTGKFGVYTRFFDFDNYRIPLSQFLVDVLDYFQINLSQLSVIAAAKISYFEILYRVHHFVSTVGNFRIFYINSKNNGWMSFSKRSDTDPVCHTRPLDSLKHWNDHFFWVDTSVFPLAVPWHNNKTLRKDPHPTPAKFNADVCNYLAGNPSPFRKFSEPLLCFVDISRYYDLDDSCYPTFLTDDDEEMDLFAFIHYADPTKMLIREREVAEGEVLLLELTRGRVVPLAGVNEQGNHNEVVQDVGAHVMNEESGDDAVADQVEEGDHVVQDEWANIVRIEDEVPASVAERAKGADHGTSGAGGSTGGKSVAALQGLLEHNTLHVEVGVAAVSTLPFVTSSVSHTLKREGGGHTNSITGHNLRTQRTTERFVVLLDSSHHSSTNAADDEVTSIIRYLVSDPPIITTAVATTVVADTSSTSVPRAGTELVPHSIFRDSTSTGEAHQDTYIPKWNASSDSALDDPDVFRGVIDHLAPPVIFSQLYSMDYEQLFVEFNVGAACQTCLSSEVRLRSQHELRGRKKFEVKCAMQIDWLKERDAEIASLKAQLSLKEADAANAIRLHSQVSAIEAAKATRVAELDSLKERAAALEGQVAALESATVSKDAELASSNAQISTLTRDLSNFQLSCDELSIKAASLEFDKDKLIDQIKAVQDEHVRVLSDRVAGLDSELMEMDLHMDEEFYPRYLTTIAGRRWILSCCLKLADGLTAGIDHRKAGRGLIDVAAYNPSAESNYLSAIKSLHAVDFPLLAQLESHKDASMADIMDLLRLEGPAAEALEASQLQPLLKQLMLPIYRLEDQVVIRETSLSFSLDPLSAENLVGEASTSGVLVVVTTTALSITFIQASSVPPIPVADDGVLGAEQPTKVPSPSNIVFEKEELETTPKHTIAS